MVESSQDSDNMPKNNNQAQNDDKEETKEEPVFIPPTEAEVKSQAEKMLNGRAPDNALLENIARKGQSSYYYAHAPKDFSIEGAKHFEGDGKIYGGAPTLIKKLTDEESANRRELEQKKSIKKLAISKFSWEDKDEVVKIRVEFSQFKDGPIEKDNIDVDFEQRQCELTITDQAGAIHTICWKKLHDKIEPETSAWAYSEKRVTITLKKWLATAWKELLVKPTK